MWGSGAAVWLVVTVLPLFLGGGAQLHNDAHRDKLVYAGGNHWAVGHLMGKKSLDETVSLDESEVNAHLFRAEADTHTRPPGLLKALVKLLAGPERETEDERERREQSMELRRWWEEQLARQREVNQAAEFLSLALNPRDTDGS